MSTSSSSSSSFGTQKERCRAFRIQMESEVQLRVLAAAKALENRREPPLAVAMDLARSVVDGLPSPELAHAIVAAVCSLNTSPSMWKLLEQAIVFRFVLPLHALALLTGRFVFPSVSSGLFGAAFCWRLDWGSGWCPIGRRSRRRTDCISSSWVGTHSLHRPCRRGLAEISMYFFLSLQFELEFWFWYVFFCFFMLNREVVLSE